MMAGLMAVAPVLVRALFHDPDWEAAVPLMIWMGPLGVVLAVSLPLHAIYVSLGRSLELFVYGLLFGVISSEAYLLGSLYGGVLGVAIAGTVTHCIMAYFYFAVPFRFIHLKVRTLVAALMPYFVASSVMGGLVYGARRAFFHWGMDPRFSLALCVMLGVVIYGAAMFVLRPPALDDFRRFLGIKAGRLRGASKEAV
ncbi:MAG: polysaccharide biosynthesis C-terminal domain-containing protein [Planctomycetota bacterium]